MPPLYKQTDKRWSYVKLGFSNKTTIGQGGCVISCIGYLHNLLTGENLDPSVVNAKLKAVGAFSGSLILWGKVQLAFPELVWKYRDGKYSNPAVWSWINIWPRVPVLVENKLSGSVSGSHWRLFIGGGKCYDPLRGEIRPTSDYKELTGSARYSKK